MFLRVTGSLPVEKECWLLHAVVDALEVVVLELLPLSHDADCVRVFASFVGVLEDGDVVCWLDDLGSGGWVVPLELGACQVLHDLRLCDLGIKDGHLSTISSQALQANTCQPL